jgi:hypothetical protein
LVKDSRQAFSNGIVQATVLCEHGCALAPGDFVDVHGNFDNGAIQHAECVQKVIDLTDSGAVIPPWLFVWLGHRITSVT